jgi:hypothetical protein
MQFSLWEGNADARLIKRCVESAVHFVDDTAGFHVILNPATVNSIHIPFTATSIIIPSQQLIVRRRARMNAEIAELRIKSPLVHSCPRSISIPSNSQELSENRFLI